MVPPNTARILVGISLDPDDSTELLSWAIRVLARPSDTIVAVHILVRGETKQPHSVRNEPCFRQTKSFVISVLGEFASICQSKQVNLEARVGFSSSVGRGLIKEANALSAEFLLLRGSRNRFDRDRDSCTITRYCFEHAPEGCSVVSVGKYRQLTEDIEPCPNHVDEISELNIGSLCSDTGKNNELSSVQKLVIENRSPKTVLDEFEVESQTTEEDSFSTADSTITTSTSSTGEANSRKRLSALKLITTLLHLPFDCKKSKRSSCRTKQEPLLKCFSYEEISKATNNFHPGNLVGEGGYSEVYKGHLQDGRIVAVKRLTKGTSDESKEREFLTELGIIGHVSHPNTANLVGCCIENGFHLIFNFSPNGTLASALHGNKNKPLDWSIRYKVIIGVARGLHYLHKCCKRRIIHRDIKASNVLLGPDCEPQISDFGLAKWLPNKWTHRAVVPIEGTFGYLAPEYFLHGIVDEKTDVFAFGVLLLEIITGRKPVDSSKRNLLLWATPLMERGKVAELVDPKLEGKYDIDQMQRVVLTASYCIRQSSRSRPSMSEAFELLITGNDTGLTRRWKSEKYESEEMDDFSMLFGYDISTDISLEDI